MIESAGKSSPHARSRGILALLVAVALIVGCTNGDAGTDPEPQVPATSRSTVAPGTATFAPDAPSPTAFLRPTSVVNPTATPIPDQVSAVVKRAAENRDLDPNAIMLLTFSEETWSSTALGCPEEGRSYAQIVTSGYEVLLSIAGEIAIYHVDQSGVAIVQCERGNRG